MRFAVWVAVLTVIALGSVELSMQPDAGDRLTFVALFSGVAALSLTVGWAVQIRTDRARSVRQAILWPSLLAVAIPATTVIAAAQLMFISAHDRNVTLAALGFGAGVAVAIHIHLSSRLEQDLRSVGRAAHAFSQGDRSARTGVSRHDELGTTAAAFDAMAERITQGEIAQRRLFASLGHDLRTPLAALQAAVEALQDGVALDEDRYLRAMGADIDALSGLIDDLLLIARVETGQYQPPRTLVDLAEVAGDAARAVTPVALDRHITVSVQASGNTVVEGGRSELGRAVRNLLDNAIRYSPDRSLVSVIVSNGGPQATLRVIDEGPGFDSSLGDSVFEEFTTADPARRRAGAGFGLGLAIVRTVAETHGGSTGIEPGPGGRVFIRLPVAPLALP